MGQGFSARCKKCGFEISLYSGIGMLYPQWYEEMIHELATGRFGRGVERFYFEHEYVGVNFENKLYHCKDCNRYVVKPCLDMYVLDKPQLRNYTGWSSALPNGYYECVFPEELEKLPVGRKYIHRCFKCRNPMEAVDEDKFVKQLENGEITCPKCGDTMYGPLLIMWD